MPTGEAVVENAGKALAALEVTAACTIQPMSSCSSLETRALKSAKIQAHQLKIILVTLAGCPWNS